MQQGTSQLHPDAIKGLRLFNQQSFYDAHEFFEEAWRAAPLDEREFYRALLQLCGGFFRLTQDKPAAARKFFDRALFWLEPFRLVYKSMDVAGLRSDLQALINALDAQTPTASIIAQHYHPLNLPPQETL